MPRPESFEGLFISEEEKKRQPVYKFKKKTRNKEGQEEEKEFVSVLGIELEVNREGRGTQFEEKDFKDFSLDDEKTKEILKILAKTIKLNQPPLIEGPTDIGKSRAVEYLAFLTNHELIYQSFSSQTDVSELIGKYVPSTESGLKTFERILSSKNRRNLKPETLAILEARRSEEEPRGLSEEECKKIAALEGMNIEKVEWIWQDGTVPRAMEANGGKGCWLYFDELGAAEPQILVKLNRIFARGIKRLEITENGGRELLAGDNFRLIATTNPPSYAGREPFEEDFLRRWVYQQVADLSSEDFLKRLNFIGHGRGVEGGAKFNEEGKLILENCPEIDGILNGIIASFRKLAQDYLEKIPREPGEQKFRFNNLTDAIRVLECVRGFLEADNNLLGVLRDAIELYYLGKVKEDKKDSDGKLVRKKIKEILEILIREKKIEEKINKEIEKLKKPETKDVEGDEIERQIKELEEKARKLKEKLGLQREKEGGIDVISTTNPEGKEIRFELVERLKYWREFYQKHNIDWVNLPETISISSEQAKEMQRQIKEYGFDYMMIIPENLVGENGEHYEELHKLMSEGYSETYQGTNYETDGGLSGSRDKTTKLRIILTRKVKEINEDALFKQTIDKNVDQIEELAKEKSLTGLAESVYLIFQRDFFEETGQHLDYNYWTWLLDSRRPASSRVPHVHWGSGTSRLLFYSYARGHHVDHLGGRLSGSFEV